MIGRIAALAGFAAVTLVQAAPSLAAPDGALLYKRCAACHTTTGAGVPGTYPPLQSDFRTLATKKEGRRYIVLAVTRGQSGPITVEGKPYRGVMPAQSGLNDDDIAAVLNHVGTVVARSGPAFKAFNAAEVAAARKSGAALTPAQVAQLHATAGGK